MLRQIPKRDVRREDVGFAGLDPVFSEHPRSVDVKMLQPGSIQKGNERRAGFAVLRGTVKVGPTLNTRVDGTRALAQSAQGGQGSMDLLRRMVDLGLACVDQRHVIDLLMPVGIREDSPLDLPEAGGHVLRDAHVDEERLGIGVDSGSLGARLQNGLEGIHKGDGSHAGIIGGAAEQIFSTYVSDPNKTQKFTDISGIG